jgi:hypothetical protein
MSVIGSNILAGASGQGGGYNLTNSLRFRSSASAYLNRTPASAATSRRIMTYSAWVKIGTLGTQRLLYEGYTSVSDLEYFYFNSSNQLEWGAQVNGGTSYGVRTPAVFRDPSAWYHVVIAIDTTQATDTNRIKIYVNGVQQTGLTTFYSGFPAQNTDLEWNNQSSTQVIAWGGHTGYYDGYMAEINMVDGQALTPSSFGETSTTTGVWIPKKYTGTYGTNGFYLPFTDNSALTTSSNVGLGKDFSGNANYWTTNNISITSGSTYDSMTDVPTLTSATAANYCVLSPIARGTQANGTITGGNLNLSTTTSDTRTYATFGFPTSGKYYWELTNNNSGSKGQGIASVDANGDTYHVLYFGDGNKQVDGTNTSYGASYTTNDVIGVAVDIDNNQITFYKNGTSQGAISYTFSSRPTMFPYVRREASTDASYSFNFGQRPFAYTPPTGFLRLNTFNLPTPTIGATASTTANNYFDALLYTGNGSASQRTDISWANMQPDMVWIKNRTSANNHVLHDDVRGTNAALQPNLTNATDSPVGFGTDGFGFDGVSNQLRIFTSDGRYNTNGNAYVTWGWKGSGATGVTNTNGSITSTVSANTTAGFSIVTYTGNDTSGSTVGHGLGVAPSVMIIKERSQVRDWTVYHISTGNTGGTLLNTTGAVNNTRSGWFNNTSPSSSVFTLGGSSGNDWYQTNQTGQTYVAYCFAQIAGYSAFGSYTGNGSADGVFVYTGFRPKYVMVKRTDSTGNWFIWDSARETFNVMGDYLLANASDAEPSGETILDFVSNGFKMRALSAGVNASGGTYIYMAFCESPFKFSNAR